MVVAAMFLSLPLISGFRQFYLSEVAYPDQTVVVQYRSFLPCGGERNASDG